MRLVHTRQLEGSGIPYKSAQNISFEGHSFVRGITFSNRLRHLADEIYCSELAAGNSCLIVEDETHFTIWHQEPGAESGPVSQSEPNDKPTSSSNRVQHFVQDFVMAKRIKPLTPCLAEEPVDHWLLSGNASAMTEKDYRSQQNAIQPKGFAAQTSHPIIRSLSPVQSKTGQPQLTKKTPLKTFERRSRKSPGRNLPESAVDLWNKPYLDSLAGSTPFPDRSPSQYNAADKVADDLTKVWINLSQSE